MATMDDDLTDYRGYHWDRLRALMRCAATAVSEPKPVLPCATCRASVHSVRQPRAARLQMAVQCPSAGGPTGEVRQVSARGTPQGARLLIIVQNLPVPFDRRVWLECQALTSAGYRVAVVCPKGRGDPAYEVIDSVELYKYRPYAPGGSKVSFIAEYVYSFLATALADAQGQAFRPLRRDPGLQPAGHLLAARPGLPHCSRAHVSCSTTTTCARSFINLVSPAVRSCLTKGCWPSSAGHTGPPITSSPRMTLTGRSR